MGNRNLTSISSASQYITTWHQTFNNDNCSYIIWIFWDFMKIKGEEKNGANAMPPIYNNEYDGVTSNI